MTIDATIARLRDRGRQAIAERDESREARRARYPLHAALWDDWIAATGVTPSGVTIDGVTVGKKQPDRIPREPLLDVSTFVRLMAEGRIQPTGEVRAKKRKPIAYEVTDE
jgi:hypothetical protein